MSWKRTIQQDKREFPQEPETRFQSEFLPLLSGWVVRLTHTLLGEGVELTLFKAQDKLLKRYRLELHRVYGIRFKKPSDYKPEIPQHPSFLASLKNLFWEDQTPPPVSLARLTDIQIYEEKTPLYKFEISTDKFSLNLKCYDFKIKTLGEPLSFSATLADDLWAKIIPLIPQEDPCDIDVLVRDHALLR